jgi:hypothetical protein
MSGHQGHQSYALAFTQPSSAAHSEGKRSRTGERLFSKKFRELTAVRKAGERAGGAGCSSVDTQPLLSS